MRLTKKAIEGAPHHGRGGSHYLWDDELSGFGVRLYPSGKKTFVVSYRINGRLRLPTLGRFGELTVHQARTLAMAALAKARQGEDPYAARKQLRQAPTMSDLADRYMKEHAAIKKKPTGVKNDRRMWDLYVLPILGRRKVLDVTGNDISRLHSRMRRTPYAANRTRELLRKAFNLAEVWGWREAGSNPCRHIQPYKEVKRERFLSSAELSQLTAVLDRAEFEQTEMPSVVAALRLLIFTGCRVGEILKLRWKEVDTQRNCLNLADTKTGRRTVYLNQLALAVLSGIDRVDRNPYVIVGAKLGRHLVNLKDPWYRLREQAGLSDVRLHDLRHTFASIGAASGLSLPLIGKMLGHSQASTTQRYAHLADDPLRWAVDVVGANLEAALKGSDLLPTAGQGQGHAPAGRRTTSG